MKKTLLLIGNSIFKPIPVLLLLVLVANQLNGQAPKFGNGYINLSKKNSGGTVQPGDTLEIRMSVHLPWGFNGGGSGIIYRVRYCDNVPVNTTMLTTSADSLRIITNEGLTYKRYTVNPGVNDDAGTYIATPPGGQYQVRINLGAAATAPTNNNVTNTGGAASINLTSNWPYGQAPKWWTGHLFSTAFRVRVTGSVGDTITLGAGRFVYRLGSGGGSPDNTINVTQYKVVISNADSLCKDNIGTSFAGEFAGTFGNGVDLNRPAGPSFAIPGYSFINNVSATQNVPDGNYAIVKNTSPYSSAFPNARRAPNCSGGTIGVWDSCKYRMFGGYWFIDGDHTGTNNAVGNLPPDTFSNGGYMLMVNADYVTTDAYRQTFTGLCPDTYYEFSAWVKNVCPLCGADSLLNGTLKPGVLPNLTFALDDIDRYNTGELDTIGWVKKGFVFKTGAAQTSVTFSIRNNAQGGGGNDWVLDDISVATCTPNLGLVPSGNSYVCLGNQVDVSCLVTSFFNNYNYFQWQVSHNGGSSWTDTLSMGMATPVFVNGHYEYTATFPSFIADSNQHNVRYRVRVATSAANVVNGNCSFANSATILVLVNNCQWVLKTEMLSFNGTLKNGLAHLNFTATNETNHTYYEIERSDGRSGFTKIGTIMNSISNAGNNSYRFTDGKSVGTETYYRIQIKDGTQVKYSKTIALNNKPQVSCRLLTNPFKNKILLELIAVESGEAYIELADNFGRKLKREQQKIIKGLNSVAIDNLETIAAGTYTLQIRLGDKVISQRVIKKSN